jgi:hypothetical protein
MLLKLYELGLDLARVFQALSIISKNQASIEKGCGSFSLGNEQNDKDPPSFDISRLDNIYYTVLPIEEEASEFVYNILSTEEEVSEYIYTDWSTVKKLEKGCGSFVLGNEQNMSISSSNSSRPSSTSILSASASQHDDIYDKKSPTAPEPYYTDESFLFDSQMNDSREQSDNGVSSNEPQPNHQPMKRDFVMREILNTEKNFVEHLETLTSDFFQPLSKVLNDEDRKSICINIDNLILLHKRLYTELFQACKGGRGRTERICQVFENFKEDMIKEYTVYFYGIDQSVAKCEFLNSSNSNQSKIG